MVTTYIITVILILLSGLFSGLTLGFMGLDPHALRRKIKLGNKNAKKIYPLRKSGNLLLVTLLLGNVAVNSALALFLGSLMTGVMAGLLATAIIVIFGEILPQSFFSRHALRYGARTTWLVWIFLYLFYPISKPIAWLLDKLLGRELPTIFSKKEVHLILEEQKEHEDSDLQKHEYEILQGGLRFSEKIVGDVMTKRGDIFSTKLNTVLDRGLLVEIQKRGHSRIPVFNKDEQKIVGMLFAKDLICIEPAQRIKVKQLMKKNVVHVFEQDKLDKVMNLFKKKGTHLFIVKDFTRKITGIITLEDVIEQIVGDIVDEHDK